MINWPDTEWPITSKDISCWEKLKEDLIRKIGEDFDRAVYADARGPREARPNPARSQGVGLPTPLPTERKK